jgi:hypothetical protein
MAQLMGWLCVAAEVGIHGDIPRIQQPFWDVEPISIALAPDAELIREDIGLWRQL